MADATQPTAVNRSNAEHYRWGVDCDAWYLMKDPQFTVIEELMEIDGEVTLVRAGSVIRILPGMKHQIRNPSPEAVRLLVVSHPPSRGDRIDDQDNDVNKRDDKKNRKS